MYRRNTPTQQTGNTDILSSLTKALTCDGEDVVASSVRIFRRFWLLEARAAREPREDGVRSVGVPSTSRFWAFYGVFFW
ncbi:hypothetical protein Taro_003567 [Colocasia esculenta]|uniref:Uncharacterized protein n=1 Tax=Colocasia esculenta TaxID=4460 RepID=A0A843TMF4_COLES|nr:hypothetical protein [Colocasia esculenta]